MNDLTTTTGNSPAPITPLEILHQAVQKGIDVGQLEKLMDMQERFQKAEAKKAYDKALAAFKADPPKILKDATVDFSSQKGRTHYKHATLANVTTVINSSLSKHGLSASWRTQQLDSGSIMVTCILSHQDGHSEQTSLSAPSDNSGNKNPIQAIGSTVAYLERYTVLAITGLATHDMDDDGGGNLDTISESQINQLDSLITDNVIDRKGFLAYMRVEVISDILAADFNKAYTAIQQKIKKAGQK